jgi:hypothetical protein
MADNHLARNRNDAPDFFADDDPLAELARIVGYEELAAYRPTVPAAASRQEPAFNLEDELLREFERYDTPRLDPANDIAIDKEPGFAAPDAAPLVDAFEAEIEPDHREAASADLWPDVSSVDSSPDAPELSVEPLEASARYDDEPVDDFEVVASPQAVEQSVLDIPELEPFDFGAAPHAAIAAEEPHVAPQEREPGDSIPDRDPAAFGPGAFDLASELESSIGVVSAAPTLAAPARKATGYVPGFRMPLANFSTVHNAAPASSSLRAEPIAPVEAVAAEPIKQVEPSVEALVRPIVEEPVAQKDSPSPSEAVSLAPAMQPAISAPASARDEFSALDELIQDVERYAMKPAAPVKAAIPAIENPAALVTAPGKAPVAPEPVTDIEDPFADHEFELALDDLELDLDLNLADLSLDDEERAPAPEKAPVVAQRADVPAAPVKAEPVRPIMSEPSPAPEPLRPAAAVAAPFSPVAAAPVASVAKPQPAPAAEVLPPAAMEAQIEEDAPLAFDPAMIADAEEQPEAIADFDVPALPVEEPEQAPVYRPDYELDLDAELASLLREPVAEKAAPAVKEAAPERSAPAAAVAQPAKPSAYNNDLDEFEKALEEDFRRSLATPLPAEAAAERETVRQAAIVPDAEVASGRFSARSIAVPLAFLGVLLVGGGAIYAFMGSGAGIGGSGEPVVIAADNDPIKVLPENPGGKTVPNQDKAVYDRVAGAGQEEPKQESLISSSEEPVDVVQKTLMPETLPLEGENEMEFASTPVGETEDPRLLPEDAPQPVGTVAGDQPVSVMPRRVKTMVVRPDGTLVEQEISEPAPAAPATETAQAAAPALAAPTDVGGLPAAPAEPIDVAAVADTAPIANSAFPDPALASPPPAEAMAVSAPAEAAAPPSAAVSAPIPVARPAEQPVNVVAAVSDQGNVRQPPQAQAPTTPAAQQTASIAPGGYVIQIASLPSQADAQRSYQNLSSKFASVIGGRGVDIKAAEIAGKGTFYRVRIPAGSKADAVALCERYRAAGGSCLVAR